MFCYIRPVGLCALISAKCYHPKNLLVVDSVNSRLELAQSLGAETWNFETEGASLMKRVTGLTDGRGADAIIGECRFLEQQEKGTLIAENASRGSRVESCVEVRFRSVETLRKYFECWSTQ